MDSYLYSVPSLIVGLAAGFQGIAERYEEEASLALGTRPAVLYLLSRGFVSAIVFYALYSLNFIQTKFSLLIILYSAACGVGSEAFLRSRITIKGGGKPDTVSEELLWGPFNLLKWYQNYWLKEIGKHLPGRRLKVFNKYVPRAMSLAALCDRVQANLPALTDEQERKRIEEGLANLKLRHDPMKNPGDSPESKMEIERRYRTELAYLIYHTSGGKETLRALLSD